MPRWQEDPSGRRFINPYDFVRLGSDVQRSEPIDGALSGKITVSLIVKTPLAIPDTDGITPDEIGHKTYPFFRVEGKPVIPGSQLRGMLRSAYETLSNSCLSVNNNNILSARHANAGNPGLIQYRDGAWHLYKAKTFKDRGQAIDSATDVRRTWYCFEVFKRDARGNVLRDSKNKPIKLKPHERLETKVFSRSGDEVEGIVNFDRAVENYLEAIEIFDTQKSGDKLFHQLKAKLTYGIRKDGRLYPVFYETVIANGLIYVYLSPSQMGRYVFDNRLDQILGTHKSCAQFNLDEEQREAIGRIEEQKKTMTLCKACALFGMISEGQRRSYASKLRFSDAQIREFDSMGFVTLKELASPKPTSVEFYTFRPKFTLPASEQHTKGVTQKDALYWTYDYMITSYKKVEIGRDRNGRKLTQSIPQKEACAIVIRGRKFYFHNPHLDPTDYQANERTKRNNTMELCKPGSRFTFEIYFDRITDQQLRELLWTITIGENDENGMQMHKLGHGKPLGLGSVKLVVESVETRSFNTETLGYCINHDTCEQVNDMITATPFDETTTSFNEFMRLTDFNGLTDIMDNKKKGMFYPIASDGQGSKNSNASHKWFIANRSMGENGSTTEWSIKYTLPVATSNNPTLPVLVPAQENRGRDNHIKPKRFR